MRDLIKGNEIERVDGGVYEMENLRCVGCGGNIFKDYGESYIGGVCFLGYRCVRCSRGVAIELKDRPVRRYENKYAKNAILTKGLHKTL